MAKQLVTLRLEAGQIGELDRVAQGLDRDRTYVISQAIDNFLEVQRWQIDYIKSAVAEADAGKFASPEAVEKTFARLRRKSKKK